MFRLCDGLFTTAMPRGDQFDDVQSWIESIEQPTILQKRDADKGFDAPRPPPCKRLRSDSLVFLSSPPLTMSSKRSAPDAEMESDRCEYVRLLALHMTDCW